MAIDSTTPAQGDTQYNLIWKLVKGFSTGAFSGGGGGGGGAVTIANGADVTLGAKADLPAVLPTESNTLMAFIKAIYSTIVSGPINVSVQNSNLNVLGNVGGYTTVIKDTTAVSTSPAYSAGDAVGGKRTISNALLTAHTGVLESVTILDRANQKAGMTLFIFDADPSAATITDNAAFVFSTDDVKVIAQVNIASSDYVTTNSKAIAQKTGLGIALKGGATTLYAALVTTSTPTFAATTDVQLEYGILQD
jgi:hypothetical protein